MKTFSNLKLWITQGWRSIHSTAGPGRPSQALKPQSFDKSPVILVLAVVSLTGAVGQRFYNEPRLAVGTPAPETIQAPQSATVKDMQATEEQREAVRQQILPVLMTDQGINRQVFLAIDAKLAQAEKFRSLAGPFPYAKTGLLSTSVQRSLRQIQPPEWNQLRAAASTRNADLTPGSLTGSTQQALRQLRAYHQAATAQDWQQLIETISQARDRYQNVTALMANSQSIYDVALLNLTDAEWQAVQQEIRQSANRILAQGISPGLSKAILQNTVQIHLSSLPQPVQPLATQLLLQALKPNLTIDLQQTRQQAEQAAQTIEPITFRIQQGEVIVNAGETIDQRTFIILDQFGLTYRRINWLGLLGAGALTGGAIAIFWGVQRRVGANLSRRDQILILLLSLSAPLLTWTAGLSYTSLPAVGLLVGSFYGSALGATVVILLTLLIPVGMKISLPVLLSIAAGSLVGGIMAGRLRSREELALLGGGVALLQGTTFLILLLFLGANWGIGYGLLSAAAWRTLVGLGWSVFALGISPYLEHLFDLVTSIRLAELANPNRPLLKRLAMEAPGTFQHTLFVASLAEAGARSLGCNVELVRTGTLYHDIGKMHDPLSFIENQMGCPNKHEAIGNPWQSAEVIKKHVTEGLVMARRHRLPKAVQAFIPEHQGTLLISYFYHQAQQQTEKIPEASVKESEFRYAGPIPQSRETGITMLADACEAALRSLRVSSQSEQETTPEEALVMVNKIFKARWQDQQLVDSQLTREDLTALAEVFVQVWVQVNHQRIRYPSASGTSKT